MPHTTALIVIDLQNDYMPHGAFPLWQAKAVLDRTLAAIARAQAIDMPVILIQHIADPAKGPSPFFNADTDGVAVHPHIRAAAPNAPIIVKHFADAFHLTDLAATLTALKVQKLLLTGMMTHNCVTHTALSKSAAAYDICILGDLCTTVSEIMHHIALSALAPRIAISTADMALA